MYVFRFSFVPFIHGLLSGFPNVLLSEGLSQPSVFSKYSWAWGVVFSSYVVIVPTMSWRVLFSAHPRSPSLASTLLPSYYCFFQCHTFQRRSPQNRIIGWFLRFLSMGCFFLCVFCALKILLPAVHRMSAWAAAVCRVPSDAIGLGFPIFFLQQIC